MEDLADSLSMTTAGAVAIVEHHGLRYLGAHLGVPAGAVAIVEPTILNYSLCHLGVHLNVPVGAVAVVEPAVLASQRALSGRSTERSCWCCCHCRARWFLITACAIRVFIWAFLLVLLQL